MEEALNQALNQCKSTRNKRAVKLFEDSDTTMSAVRKFEEKAVQTGCPSIIKDGEKYMYASKLHLTLTSQHPNPRATTKDGDEIGGKKLKTTLVKA